MLKVIKKTKQKTPMPVYGKLDTLKGHSGVSFFKTPNYHWRLIFS